MSVQRIPELVVRAHDIGSIPEGLITYAVILARKDGKWIYVRHKLRDTWEIPGGKRESGEMLTKTAERELFEETGATAFSLTPIRDYEVDRSGEFLPASLSSTTQTSTQQIISPHPSSNQANTQQVPVQQANTQQAPVQQANAKQLSTQQSPAQQESTHQPLAPLTYAYLHHPQRSYGRLFWADMQTLGPLPDSEIAEIRLFADPPEKLTYPLIQPALHEEGLRWLLTLEDKNRHSSRQASGVAFHPSRQASAAALHASKQTGAAEKLTHAVTCLLSEPFPFTMTLGLSEAAAEGFHRIHRTAIRLIAFKDDRVLLMKNRRGDVKFPGGGMEPGETELDTLARECEEESGFTPKGNARLIGTILERRYDAHQADAVFEMASRYYVGDVGGEAGEQRLDPYEAELKFSPVWLTLQEACDMNTQLLDGPAHGRNHWVERDTIVLRLLQTLQETQPDPQAWGAISAT